MPPTEIRAQAHDVTSIKVIRNTTIKDFWTTDIYVSTEEGVVFRFVAFHRRDDTEFSIRTGEEGVD